MRNDQCPICGRKSSATLALHFNQKMGLPTEVTIRSCDQDNWLFVGNGDQASYDSYYTSLANDSYHQEIAGADGRSPIAILQRQQLLNLVGDFFRERRTVLDFGCGEAWLLQELAAEFPSSNFWGVDPSPAVQVAADKIAGKNLPNLHIGRQLPTNVTFDLIIASHVVEHLIDFDLLRFWHSLLSENGLLYVEVPNALQYVTHERLEFLYYLDRLHVNHFTPQSLAQLLARHGFGYLVHFEYAFPYRDGKPYPALGTLFQKDGRKEHVTSPNMLETANSYISQEQIRAKVLKGEFKMFDGVLVWGAGDNFYRSLENGGPLSDLPAITLLDKRPQRVNIGTRSWTTEIPGDGIRRYPWPVIVTVSERRKEIADQVKEIDPSRKVFFV